MTASLVKVYDGSAWQEVRDSYCFDGTSWVREKYLSVRYTSEGGF